MKAISQLLSVLLTMCAISQSVNNNFLTREETASKCLWIGYQKLECHIKALDDTFGAWVMSKRWPTPSRPSTNPHPHPFNYSLLSSSLISSSSVKSSSSLMASSQRNREQPVVMALTIKCHYPAFVNSTISALTFQGLETVSALSISGCKLTSVASEAFISLRRLKKLEIELVTYEHAPEQVLKVQKNSIPSEMEEISVSFNKMESFPSSVICNISNLNTLRLSDNHIKDVEELGFLKNQFDYWGETYEQVKEDLSLREVNNKDISELEKNAIKLPRQLAIGTNISALLNLSADVAEVKTARPLCFKSLRSLSLSRNSIIQLHPRAFRTLKQLKSLLLSRNVIRNVSSEAFEGLENLRVLDLSSNHITSLEKRTFQNCLKLEELNLRNNSIEIFGRDIFKGLKELQILDLSCNNLTFGGDYKIFYELRRLVILNLSRNKISWIHNFLFDDLMALQKLDLSFNKLTVVERKTFNRMFNLYELNLSNNKLKRLSNSSFDGLVGLNLLNLDSNSLKYLPSTVLLQSLNLKQVLLSNNEFNELPIAVQNLSFLNYLDLSDNNILRIEPYSFLQLSNLHVLNLSSNLLSNISKKSFDDLYSLKVLDLSGNNIYTMKEGTLDKIKDLKVLKISRNKLNSINELFAGMEYLEELDLSENSISMFDYAFLPRQLLKLVISKNNIKQLGNYFKVHSVLALQEIDASYNQIKVISEVSLPNAIKWLSLEQNIVDEVKPGAFRDKVAIEYINFRMNQLSKLSPKSISPRWIIKNQKEAILYLGGNSLFCDCEMEWLYVASLPLSQSFDNKDRNHRLPLIADVEDVVCTLPHSIGNLTTYKKINETTPENFLCSYDTHCFTLCQCCDFIACDCQMKCPKRCSCFHDDTWSINLVDCSKGDLNRLPDKVPMDATIVFLDGNDLKILHAHHFIGRHSIQKLHLNNSNIQILHNRTFHGLSSLKYLFLQDNMIVQLNGFEFSDLSHLVELHLQNNRISFINNNTFQELSSLQLLRIDNNFIVDFPVWILSNNLHLKRINLSNNPWDCSCEYINALKNSISFTRRLMKDSNKVFCIVDGLETMWSSITESGYLCLENDRGVRRHHFGQKNLPFIAGGLCGGVVLITIVVVVLMFLVKNKIAVANKLGFVPSSPLCHEEDGKVFDAYIIYSVRDTSFVRDVLAPKLENGTPSYKLCLHFREFPETTKISDFIAQSICFSRKVIILLSKSYIDMEWRNFTFKRAIIENITNEERNLIIINYDGIQRTMVEQEMKALVKKGNIIKWGEKYFWKQLKDLLPPKSVYSGLSLYISNPLHKSPVLFLPHTQNSNLPTSSSVLTSKTGLTTPSDSDHFSLVHEPHRTYKPCPASYTCHSSSCNYTFMSSEGCQRHHSRYHSLSSAYSTLDGESSSVHAYHSFDILARQTSFENQTTSKNHSHVNISKSFSSRD